VQATFPDGRTAVTALPIQVFSSPLRGLTVSASGDGSGTVSSNSAGISCPPTCHATFAEGAMVRLTVTASRGSTFRGWDSKGVCAAAGTNTACRFTMPANAVSASATFDRGANPAMIPDVKGKSKEVASVQLRQAGFTIAPEDGSEETADSKMISKVSSTSPPAGTQAAKGSAVTLLIGKAQSLQNVTAVTGQDFATAKSNLESDGWWSAARTSRRPTSRRTRSSTTRPRRPRRARPSR
jgi:hypothetical protein